MSPLMFLLVMVIVTAAALCASTWARKARRKLLKGLAVGWNMHYSPADRFRLAGRMIERFPVPGAADIRVVDVIYGIDGDGYRYMVTAEYTAGVIHAKKRRRLICTMREPKGSQGKAFDALAVARVEGTPAEQYRELYESSVQTAA